jgi:HEPN domain-containing protein
MRPFTTNHFSGDFQSCQQEKLVSLILDVTRPDLIYMLGASSYHRKNESIFCPESTSSQYYSDYFFLILINSTNGKALYEWQDKIEQHCSSISSVTTIILETSTFNNWLECGHLFARTVYNSSICLYNPEDISLSLPSDYDAGAEQKAMQKSYTEGLNKSQEFLAGAELYKIRKQNKMAAFMLHQSTEQALHTLLKIGTGFHCCTHNIERLLRYGSMVSYRLPDVFPRKTENEKRLFSLLQKAYVDVRYQENYIINISDLLLITEKVKRLQQLLVDTGNSIGYQNNGS